jgi:hypothetical protein
MNFHALFVPFFLFIQFSFFLSIVCSSSFSFSLSLPSTRFPLASSGRTLSVHLTRETSKHQVTSSSRLPIVPPLSSSFPSLGSALSFGAFGSLLGTASGAFVGGLESHSGMEALGTTSQAAAIGSQLEDSITELVKQTKENTYYSQGKRNFLLKQWKKNNEKLFNAHRIKENQRIQVPMKMINYLPAEERELIDGSLMGINQENSLV